MQLKQRLVPIATAVFAFAAMTVALAGPAQAYWRGGVYFGFPLIAAPPPVIYAPPPVYYAPPPTYYYQPAAPVAQSQAPAPRPATDNSAQRSTPVLYGGTCYAGFYVCRTPEALPVNSQCACPGLGAPSYGVVR